MSDKIELSKEEYEEILEQLEKTTAKEDLESNYKWMCTSKPFWDKLGSKLLGMCVSFKMWILFFSLYAPYHLLKQGMISSDNYTTILVVVVPAVVGFREYSKAKVNGTGEEEDSSFLKKISKVFKI